MEKRCSVNGCNKKYLCKWLCTLHYQRLVSKWSVWQVESLFTNNTICNVNLCERKAEKKWYCTMHYQRVKNKWFEWEPFSMFEYHDVCIVPWCNISTNLKRWYCNTHYLRNKKYWDVNYTKVKRWENRMNNPLYSVYKWMRERCKINWRNIYEWYRWRWIKVCKRWLWINWFTNFLEDMWPRPEWYSIDRINNDWDYSPENCRRATVHEQSNNKRNNRKIPWVYYIKKTKAFQARMILNNKVVFQKDFRTEQEAINARKGAELKYLWNYL